MRKLASHNTMTYGRIRQWFLRPFSFMARCQKHPIYIQWSRGARLFDIRVRYHKGRMRAAHGAALYEDEVVPVILDIAELSKIYKERAYIRFVLESTSKRKAAEQEQQFKRYCAMWKRQEPHFRRPSNTGAAADVVFCGGQSKRDWHTVYDFGVELPPITECYSSMPGQKNVLYKLYPRLYAKRYNGNAFVDADRDKLLMIDFI